MDGGTDSQRPGSRVTGMQGHRREGEGARTREGTRSQRRARGRGRPHRQEPPRRPPVLLLQLGDQAAETADLLADQDVKRFPLLQDVPIQLLQLGQEDALLLLQELAQMRKLEDHLLSLGGYLTLKGRAGGRQA